MTEPFGAGRSCAATVTAAGFLSTRAEATHVVRIPDTAVGEAHQLRVWIDLDGDGVRGAREPSQVFATDFASREQISGGGARFALAEDFEITRLEGGDRVGRAGQWAVLRLAAGVPSGEFTYDPVLGEVVPVLTPLANARMGAIVYAGPSGMASVMCLVPPSTDVPSPGFSGSCVTDEDGIVVLRYRVEAPPVTATGLQQDDLRIWWDRDGDGTHDRSANRLAPEPSDTVSIPIAKTNVSYVALGDSYSSGEVGINPAPGKYVSGENPADGECRRWDRAYPTLIREGFLDAESDIDAKFEIFACTGAITLNVLDPADPGGLSTARGQLGTNRPSSAAARKKLRPARPGTPVEVDTPANWEPRQAVSLAGVQAMSGVDMVTVTLGGNDAGFAGVITRCATVGCGQVGPGVFDEVRDRVGSTLAHIREVAPDASVFVLGYPALSPAFEGCTSATPEMVDTFERTGLSRLFLNLGLSAECVSAIRSYVERIAMCTALDAGQALYEATGWDAFWWEPVAFLFASNLRIDAAEAIHLRNAAVGLNSAVRAAAASAGVHFVSVLDESAAALPDLSSADRSPCDTDPWAFGLEFEDRKGTPISDGSFHPNAEGHMGYARILEQYIRDRIAAGAELSEAGLPVNPRRRGVPGSGSRSPSADRDKSGEGAESSALSRSADAGAEALDTSGYLLARRASTVSGCGAPFTSPGERVRLTSDGFAANATVSLTARAASLGTVSLSAPMLVDGTADADGALDLSWTVPTAPDPAADPAPRAYAVDASGDNSAGDAHTAHMVVPLVSYPGTAPCAAADTASTALGATAQIAVLTNDVAPTGGSLNEMSVAVQPAAGGAFSADASGVVTFTPDPGFWGTVETTYTVLDGWGIGVGADLTVTVDGGCTITGTAGVELIEGTSGNDVICVPDRDDHRAFHIIDAKGGDDTILGGAGVEWVYGGDGADTIYGNGGDDRIVAGAGIDTIRGGPGVDEVLSVDLADAVIDDDYEMILSPWVTIPPSGPEPADDWVWVDVSRTVLVDVLGNDHDANEDLDHATLTVRTVPASGTASVRADGGGRTVVEYTAGASGGSDGFSYEVCDALGGCATGEVTVMVGTSGCTMVGTSEDDVLVGTSGDDVICGLGGNDTILGFGGDDVIVGGAGDDRIYGGDYTLIGSNDGDDIIWGGPGDDTVWEATERTRCGAVPVMIVCSGIEVPIASWAAPATTSRTAAARAT